MTTCPTIRFDIFIAGDRDQAKQACREYCFAVGLCVTVEPVAYIYTGGEETGVRVGIINYPRFPSTHDELREKARQLASALMVRLCQHSYSIVGPDETEWFSRRPESKP
jgi:ferredoxin